MKSGFKLYQDLTSLVVNYKKKHFANIYLVLFFAKLVKTEEGFDPFSILFIPFLFIGYITQKNVPEIEKALKDEEPSLMAVANSYKPKIILNKSTRLKQCLSIEKEGTANNLKGVLEAFEKQDDPLCTLLLFDKKKIVGLHYSSKTDRFSPYIGFEPIPKKKSKVNLYYFKSQRLVEVYVKQLFEVSTLRYNIVKVDDKADEENVLQLDPPSTPLKDVTSPSGFNNFIDQFISGEKRPEPTDRLLIAHEREIKLLKKELQQEKEYSAKLFTFIIKLQQDIESIDVKKIGKVSTRIKKEVSEIKKLNKFKTFEELSTCVVCLTKPKDTLLLPCKHICLCTTCYPRIKEKFGVCPICQQEFKDCIMGIKYV